MPDDADCEDRINSFALVGYVPGRIGEFFNKLRREMVPGCSAMAHVTILPPREIRCEMKAAAEQIGQRLQGCHALTATIGSIQVFSATSVIYANILNGRNELLDLHEDLAGGCLACNECFCYHPHITLAQGLHPEQIGEAVRLASARWAEFDLRSFCLDRLTFVQNTAANRWLDLLDFKLRSPAFAFTSDKALDTRSHPLR